MSRYRSGFKVTNFSKEKHDQKISQKTVPIKMHTVIESLAEIVIPNSYRSNKIDELIALVTIGQIPIWAQINEHSFSDKNNTEISILKNLVQISGVKVNSKSLMGEMKLVQKDRIPKDYYLQFVEVLVKGIYMSRRDQFKIMQHIQNNPIHVYNRKITNFHELKLHFTNMINKKGEIAKSGMVGKSTKLIYRTACSKYSILFEICEEMFELNERKELYLEKAIDFLLLFFLRNNFFQTDHRIEIFLFARVFYPQFTTLNQAYESLRHNQLHENSKSKQFQTNYASSLQKDYTGAIFQDMYRRILWNNKELSEFRLKFTRKISQFIFTMNLQDSSSYMKYVRQTMKQTHLGQMKERENHQNSRYTHPYIHKLPGVLSNSEKSCYFQSISLVSEQYKHHYVFRSLKETGNAIMIISAGKSFYLTDKTTYKMAKSNVYLTNIHALHVNLRRYTSEVAVKVTDLGMKSVYFGEDAANKGEQRNSVIKIRGLIDWIKQKIAYNTPKSVSINFPDGKFQMKSVIDPRDLEKMTQKQLQAVLSTHYSAIQQPLLQEYYFNRERPYQAENFRFKNKEIKWIRSIQITQNSFNVHNILYGHISYSWVPFTSKKCLKVDTFERDLQLLVNKKKDFDQLNFGKGEATELIKDYIRRKRIKSKKLHDENRDQLYLNYKGFEKVENEQKKRDEEELGAMLFEIASINNKKDPYPPYEMSEVSNFNDSNSSPRSNKQEEMIPLKKFVTKPLSRKVNRDVDIPNIFEETFSRGQYVKKAHFQINEINLVYPKLSTHNKQRQANNHRECPMHYMMTYFTEDTLQTIEKSIFNKKKQSKQWRIDQKGIDQWLKIERQWKQVIFPLLTPIYTPFIKRQKENSHELREGQGTQSGEFAIEEEICKYLMENFQIQENINSNNINLTKGHVKVSLFLNSRFNVTPFEQRDTIRQMQIIPHMLYRFLSYEEKDSRFGSKFIILGDENFYDKNAKQKKKSIKIAFVSNSQKEEQNFARIKDFFACFKQRYTDIKQTLKLLRNKFEAPNSITKEINLVTNSPNKIYRNQVVEFIIDNGYHPENVFSVVIQWNHCCAVYIYELIQFIRILAKKCKLNYHLVSTTNPFEIDWNISTVSEIIMSNKISMDMVEKSILGNSQWLWDHSGYFLNREGLAFLRVIKQKNLIEWKENELEKNKWEKPEEIENFKSFLLNCEVIDVVGHLIEKIV